MKVNIAKVLDLGVEQGLRAGLKRCMEDNITDEERCFNIIHSEVVSSLLDWMDPDEDEE